MKYDFSGYATKNNVRCTDGRMIMPGAFDSANGKKVPLVWQHIHDDPGNVLGHAVLEKREDGVYAYCTLNDTPAGKNAKMLVEHGDINAMSIYANQLKQDRGNVSHGEIREVSLVLSGANPGALIDNLSMSHGDGTITELDDEAIIYTGEELKLFDGFSHADGNGGEEDEETIQDVFDTLNDKQKNMVYVIIGMALADAEEGGDTMEQSEDYEGGDIMKYNVFDGTAGDTKKNTLTHAQFSEILAGAEKLGSFKQSFIEHAQSYGIENIDILFPDAKLVTNPPDWIKRQTEWVSGVINGAKHSPFSRIKSAAADITADAARAKGYVKGNLKKEEVFKLSKRVTTPTTIYKKQKFDRDDLIDITDLDVIAWVKAEMRLMLEEELARAVLVGDGREADDNDKINEENIRPIWKEPDMYAIHVQVENTTTVEEKMEAILRAMDDYEGTGSPTLYIAPGLLTDMLLLKDKIGRRYYNTKAEVASALGVGDIVTVPIMKGLATETADLFGIIVNMKDYTIGADRGGEISMFDDFDIDYNQYKYLLETRCSGSLTHPHSAIVVEVKKASTPAG